MKLRQGETIDRVCERCGEYNTHYVNGSLVSERDLRRHSELKEFRNMYLITCYGCKNTYVIKVSDKK